HLAVKTIQELVMHHHDRTYRADATATNGTIIKRHQGMATVKATAGNCLKCLAKRREPNTRQAVDTSERSRIGDGYQTMFLRAHRPCLAATDESP
ncbi:MAG: hypothetical protein IT536_14155, partial [Hyphomicrobiales bacterium]|nr:hypothetical protein [Hyphomicrobiales bacterium]